MSLAKFTCRPAMVIYRQVKREKPTTRNRLPTIAANHRRPESGTGDPPGHSSKKIHLVGGLSRWAFPQADKTKSTNYCMAS